MNAQANEYKLVAGDLEAVFLPGMGMLGTSLRYRGVELLRRVDDLESAAAKGSTAGIPLLYPWANRLAVPVYIAEGKEVVLDVSSPLLHTDDQGLLIHGVKWALLKWEVVEATMNQLKTRLDWNSMELLEVFPFRHQVEMEISLSSDSLTIGMKIFADEPMPVAFGFHPYFGLPDEDRSQWRLEMPAMDLLLLDSKKIPNGIEQFCSPFDSVLGEKDIDAGYALQDAVSKFSLSGNGCRISVEFLENYPFAQIFAPKNKNFIAIEPMTAASSALTSGNGLQHVQPGQLFSAKFRISIDRE